MLSKDFVIRSRQAEIVNEVHTIEEEIRACHKRIEELTQKRDLRIAEHDLLDKVEDRGIIVDLGNTSKRSQMNFEDCMKRIFDNAGRPMKMSEIINELEKFNYIWSSYHSAYQRITGAGIVQVITRGYYQLLK